MMSMYLSFIRCFTTFTYGINWETPENLNYLLYVRTVDGFS